MRVVASRELASAREPAPVGCPTMSLDHMCLGPRPTLYEWGVSRLLIGSWPARQEVDANPQPLTSPYQSVRNWMGAPTTDLVCLQPDDAPGGAAH